MRLVSSPRSRPHDELKYNITSIRAALHSPAASSFGMMVTVLDQRGVPVWRGDVPRRGTLTESWPRASAKAGASARAGAEQLSAPRYEVHPVSSIGKALVSALFLLVCSWATHGAATATPFIFPSVHC